MLIDSPPYHSLLRTSPAAYYQQAPRVWVTVGWRHPLVEKIFPPAGHIVLLQPGRPIEIVADGPFAVGPESFALPSRPSDAVHAADVALAVAVRLVADHAADPSELWVLHDRPFDRLRALAEQSDDRLLGRLSLAVGETNGRQVAVLRVIPGRGGPPVLVLDALACRPFLRLPNLYLPVGTTAAAAAAARCGPPAVRAGRRHGRVAGAGWRRWVRDTRLPESAFRPLEQAIVYTREHGPQPLAASLAGQPFALQPFVVHERRHLCRAAGRVLPQSSRPRRSRSPPEPELVQEGLSSRIVQWFLPTARHPLGPPSRESRDAGRGRAAAIARRLGGTTPST